MTLAEYLRMPWTIVRENHDDDGAYLSLRIEELPGFVVAGRSEDEVEAMFWESLAAFLQSYTEAGESPPMPTLCLSSSPQLELQYERPRDLIARYQRNADARSVSRVPTSVYPRHAAAV